MGKKSERIYVTRPSLPPIREFTPYLEKIWNDKWLTNMGCFHDEFELELCKFLGVKHISLFANGTTALMVALKALQISSEVITTPYSFVATSHVLQWNDINPVFVDIEPNTFNIDPKKIEAAITSETQAILPVHIYGNPCNVNEIERIAHNNGLKVIYDACHTFDVRIDNVPVLNFGDLSVLSFHATKVFNTFEGGAIVCHDQKTKTKIDRIKNFGFVDETHVEGVGINGKMNEFQSALGILQLNYIDKYILKRKKLANCYRKLLQNIKGIHYLNDLENIKQCYSYFPILIDEKLYGKSRDELYYVFKEKNIYTRRYFYPLISHFPAFKDLPSSKKENLPIAEKISTQVLCLPLYEELNEKDVEYICNIID